MNKLLSIIFFVAIICSASHSHSGAITDSVFSGTTLASLNDITAKSSGGNPVGTIIAWPVAQNPEDMENWLECNGQSISPTVYPELSALLGPSVPDLRGLFLRGQGGNSAALSTLQGDAIRNITGRMSQIVSNAGLIVGNGVFANGNSLGSFNWGGASAPYPYSGYVDFDASRIVPTAPENRPVNMAVRYLVRALP